MDLITFACMVLFAAFLYGLADKKNSDPHKAHVGKYIFQSTQGETAGAIMDDLQNQTGVPRTN